MTSQTKVPCTKTPYVGVAVVASGHDEPNKVPCTKTPYVGVAVVASGHDDKENTKERTQRNRYGLAPPPATLKRNKIPTQRKNLINSNFARQQRLITSARRTMGCTAPPGAGRHVRQPASATAI